MSDIVLFAHRGSNPYPDHSRDAYVWAVNWGADFIEPDLYLTKDGVLVSSHDNHNYSNLTYAEAKALEPALLTFGEVIELVKAMSIETGRDIGIIPETKSTDYATSEAVIQTLIAHDFTDPDRVVIQSFSATNLQQLNSTIMPQYGVDIPLAYLGTGIVNPTQIATFADIVAPSVGSFTAADVAAAHAAGLKVTAWTILGAQADIQSLINMGVDSVFADDTKLARASIEAINGSTTVYGSAAADTAAGTAGNNVVYAMQGDDLVRAKDGDDLGYGDGGNDVVFGGNGNDILVGGSGTDFLSGDAGTDVLDGGAGNDVIVASGDTVLFRPGSGIDLVTLDATSTITFQDIASGAVTVIRSGADLIVRAGGDALVIHGGANAAGRPGSVTFADGVTLTGSALAALAVDGTDAGVAAALPALETLLADAPSLDVEPPAPINHIVNGGFEDLTGANDGATWGYRNTSPAGVIAGWVNVSDTRAEVHRDTVGGISAAEGTYWFDMEGANKNAKLVQTVAGVEAGKTYQLSFQIADTDTAQTADTIKVYWGGQIIYTGIPKNKWQEITIDVVGGAGDGSNKLTFESVTASSNGAGVALDNVAMILVNENPNLIVNGSFEDLTGANNGNWSGDWGYRNDSGVIPGWTQTNTSAGGRAELHFDTQNGVAAADGNVWFDMDGNKNNAKLVQTVAGVEARATYRLTFFIADADATTTDDGVRVTWGGQVVYEGVPTSAWQKITIDVVGGAGDGTNQLIFQGTESNLNGYGAALDDVSLRKIADAPPPNSAPVAHDDTLANVIEDAPSFLISFASLLGNDTDANDDDLSITALADIVGGTAVIEGNAIRFTPDANFHGDASFTYTVNDGHGGTSQATASFSVTSVNDGPVAVAEQGTAGEDEAQLFDVVANDTDIDGDALSLTGFSVTGVSGVALSNAQAQTAFSIQDGKLAFDGGDLFDALNDGQTATVTISYTVQDPQGASSTANFVLTVNGANEANVVIGNNSANALFGTEGVDIVSANDGNDSVFGRGGNDIINAGNGTDTVFGGAGNDIIDGGAGKDTLMGDAGNDVLAGGQGNDLLYGGDGNDTFVFHAGEGRDTVFDFKAGALSGDVIELDHSIFADFQALMQAGAVTDTAIGVQIAYGDGSVITLSNVHKSDLAIDDFRFA